MHAHRENALHDVPPSEDRRRQRPRATRRCGAVAHCLQDPNDVGCRATWLCRPGRQPSCTSTCWSTSTWLRSRSVPLRGYSDLLNWQARADGRAVFPLSSTHILEIYGIASMNPDRGAVPGGEVIDGRTEAALTAVNMQFGANTEGLNSRPLHRRRLGSHRPWPSHVGHPSTGV
jgi:hypothetical protein